MREFDDEVTVLSRWLGRDVSVDLSGAVPVWSAFRFRDAAVFASEAAEWSDRMYLVRQGAVREFVVSQVTIDEAYAQLRAGAEPVEGTLPAAA